MPVEEVFEGPLNDYRRQGQFRCRLCEIIVPRTDRKAHAREHRGEYRAWKSDKERSLRRERTQRLKHVNQLLKESRA